MSDEGAIILQGDSMELMKHMESNSIDLIFADEPYNIGKDFGNNKDIWNTKDDYISWNKPKEGEKWNPEEAEDVKKETAKKPRKTTKNTTKKTTKKKSTK